MKVKILILIAWCLLSINFAHSQNKENNQSKADLSVFVGEWNWKSENMEFHLRLFKDTYTLKNKSEQLEVLVGRFKLIEDDIVIEDNINKDLKEEERYYPLLGFHNPRDDSKIISLSYTDTQIKKMFNIRLSIDDSDVDKMRWDMNQTRGTRIEKEIEYKGSISNKLPRHMILTRE